MTLTVVKDVDDRLASGTLLQVGMQMDIHSWSMCINVYPPPILLD